MQTKQEKNKDFILKKKRIENVYVARCTVRVFCHWNHCRNRQKMIQPFSKTHFYHLRCAIAYMQEQYELLSIVNKSHRHCVRTREWKCIIWKDFIQRRMKKETNTHTQHNRKIKEQKKIVECKKTRANFIGNGPWNECMACFFMQFCYHHQESSRVSCITCMHFTFHNFSAKIARMQYWIIYQWKKRELIIIYTSNKLVVRNTNGMMLHIQKKNRK